MELTPENIFIFLALLAGAMLIIWMMISARDYAKEHSDLEHDIEVKK